MSWYVFKFPNTLPNDNFFGGSYIGRLMILERQVHDLIAEVQTLSQSVSRLEEASKVEEVDVEKVDVEALIVEESNVEEKYPDSDR